MIRSHFAYGIITLYNQAFHLVLLYELPRDSSPTTPRGKPLGLGSFRFARRYSGNRFFFLFLQLMRCFSSLRLPSYPYGFRI